MSQGNSDNDFGFMSMNMGSGSYNPPSSFPAAGGFGSGPQNVPGNQFGQFGGPSQGFMQPVELDEDYENEPPLLEGACCGGCSSAAMS